MKKFLVTLFILISTQSFASEVKMNFTKEVFENAQKNGKTVVVNSWNKFCMTCIKQEKIIKVIHVIFVIFQNVVLIEYSVFQGLE